MEADAAVCAKDRTICCLESKVVFLFAETRHWRLVCGMTPDVLAERLAEPLEAGAEVACIVESNVCGRRLRGVVGQPTCP